MFKTKRQKREQALNRLSDEEWAKLPAPLQPLNPCGSMSPTEVQMREFEFEMARQNPDPLNRNAELIAPTLEKADHDSDFAIQLDRALHIRTDVEDAEFDIWLKRGYWLLGFATGTIALGWNIFEYILSDPK